VLKFLHQGTMVTKLFTVLPDIHGPSVCNLLHVTLLAPQILWWLVVDLWKFVHLCICLLLYMYEAILFPHVIHVTVTHVHSCPVRV
jgi:hypothetical protein